MSKSAHIFFLFILLLGGVNTACAQSLFLENCDIESTSYVTLALSDEREFYNAKPADLLRCVPSENAPEAYALEHVMKLIAIKKVISEEVVWYLVETYDDPDIAGWIKESEFSKTVIKSGSWTSFVLRELPSTSKFYDDSSVIYELRGGVVEDSLSIPTAYDGQTKMTLVDDHILNKVDRLIRYETRMVGDSVHYYQDLIAYANGKLTPLVFSDNAFSTADSADVSEYTIYLPARTASGEVYLGPLLESLGQASAEERYRQRYPFTDEISVPIDQCIVRFYERASVRGKLKKRVIEVYHWNGTDIARMYGDDIDFD